MNKKLSDFRRELILEKAGEHFKTKGFTGIQVGEIAKELKIGVGTIYGLFESKDGLFLAWVYSIIEGAYTELQKKFKKEKKPIERLRIYIDFKLSFYEKQRDLLKDYIGSDSVFLKNTARREDNPMKKIYALLAETIQILIEGTGIKIDKDYLLSAYILDNVINGFIEYYALDEKVKFNTKTQSILETFLSTIEVR